MTPSWGRTVPCCDACAPDAITELLLPCCTTLGAAADAKEAEPGAAPSSARAAPTQHACLIAIPQHLADVPPTSLMPGSHGLVVPSDEPNLAVVLADVVAASFVHLAFSHHKQQPDESGSSKPAAFPIYTARSKPPLTLASVVLDADKTFFLSLFISIHTSFIIMHLIHDRPSISMNACAVPSCRSIFCTGNVLLQLSVVLWFVACLCYCLWTEPSSRSRDRTSFERFGRGFVPPWP